MSLEQLTISQSSASGLASPNTDTSLLPSSNTHSDTSAYHPVYINVYDMAPVNRYLYWVGLGIYHSGLYIPSLNVEFCFGGHDVRGVTGVFQVPPKSGLPGTVFRKSILVGHTSMSPSEIMEVLQNISEEYPGVSYNLLQRNCNHFTYDVAERLCARSPPGWINRLAGLALMMPCIVPEDLKPPPQPTVGSTIIPNNQTLANTAK